MSATVALRSQSTGVDLRQSARRILALVVIYDAGSCSDAACIGDVGVQIVREWVLRFNARTGRSDRPRGTGAGVFMPRQRERSSI